jgi:hypothetical protein
MRGEHAMSTKTEANRLAQLTGVLAGALTFPLVALGLYFLFGSEFKAAPYGALMADSPDMWLRFGLALIAAIVTGFVSSIATRDYISGTSVLAIGLGMFLLAVTVARTKPVMGYVVGGIASPEALTVNIIEVFLSLVVILAAYFTSWQTDLHLVLPRRPGPPYEKKKVGVEELFGTNLTAFITTGVLTLVLSYTLMDLSGNMLVVSLLWFACCGVSALAARRFFPVRSTFFLWTAPGLALAAFSHEGFLSFLGSSTQIMAERYCRIPLGLLIPLSVIATTMAYLTIPNYTPAQSASAAVETQD